MNHAYIVYLLGRMLKIIGLLMIPSVIVAFIYQNSWPVIAAFLISMALCQVVGQLMSFKEPKRTDFYAHEGMVFVALAWILMSLFGALPLFISGAVPSFVDALFESVSGFTTTGASVLDTELTILPQSLLFWRSFTLMIGGMGMLVFILIILPNFGAKGVYIMRAELPGPVFGKVESRVSKTIVILYRIYIAMTLILAFLIWLGGVPVFESLLLSMGAAATGGFNIHPDSIMYYNSPYIEALLGIAMFIFGMSFDFFYLIYVGKWRQVLKSEELRWYVAIIAAATLFIAITIAPLYNNV